MSTAQRPRVAVTGIGLVTCLGRGMEVHRLALETNARGLGPLSLFPAPELAHSPVGQVPEHALEDGSAALPRIERLGLAAARDALLGAAPVGKGVIVAGTTTGSVLESEQAWLEERAKPGGEPLRRMRHHPIGELGFWLASELELQAECQTFATACSSSSNAIGYGALRIREGAPWALVGGIDTLCRMTYAGFHALRLLSRGVPRPFDQARSGVAVAESAAFLLLEPLDAAQARGARVFGEVVGWGCAVDAFHQTAPDPKGLGMIAAMRGALREAEVAPKDVAYVNAHGTATEANDRVESLAVKAVFEGEAPWISSTKGLTGHCLGAAGAVEAALCLAVLETRWAPPTAGLEVADPACDVRHVPRGGVELTADVVLSNSFGFGGNNASLAFRGAPAPLRRPARATFQPRPRAYVHGMGIVAPGALGLEALWNRLCAPPHADEVPETLAEPKRQPRLTRLERMSIFAAREALGAHPTEGTALIVGTSYGRIHAAGDFLEGLAQRGLEHGSPFSFYQSVYHALAGTLGIHLGLKGIGLTTSARELSAESALRVGLELLGARKAQRVLVVAADDVVPALVDFLPPSHPVRAGWGTGAAAGSAALLLSREPSPLEVLDCELSNHPARPNALATPLQTRAQLDAALAASGFPTLGSSFLGEALGPEVEPLDDHLRFGLNPSGGMLRIVAALLRLQRRAAPAHAIVHGLALGGGQALTRLASVPGPLSH